jgi:hypothetical protein
MKADILQNVIVQLHQCTDGTPPAAPGRNGIGKGIEDVSQGIPPMPLAQPGIEGCACHLSAPAMNPQFPSAASRRLNCRITAAGLSSGADGDGISWADFTKGKNRVSIVSATRPLTQRSRHASGVIIYEGDRLRICIRRPGPSSAPADDRGRFQSSGAAAAPGGQCCGRTPDRFDRVPGSGAAAG